MQPPKENEAKAIHAPDFIGAFAVIESEAGILMVQNQRKIGGCDRLTWDLPGGGVNGGEQLTEALARELKEELEIELCGVPEFLFYQEGERLEKGVRTRVWRSFFFRVREYRGTPCAASEIVDFRWVRLEEMKSLLDAPYHDSFLSWLDRGGSAFTSRWED